MWTRVGPRNYVLDGGSDPTQVKGQFWGRKGVGQGRAQTCPKVDILKATQQWQHRYGADADWGVLDGVHIGATWRIRLNRSCAATTRPYVKSL